MAYREDEEARQPEPGPHQLHSRHRQLHTQEDLHVRVGSRGRADRNRRPAQTVHPRSRQAQLQADRKPWPPPQGTPARRPRPPPPVAADRGVAGLAVLGARRGRLRRQRRHLGEQRKGSTGASGTAAASVASTLTIADTAFPTTMDPGGGQNAYNQYYDLAYDPLIVQTVSGGYAPGLATSWSYGPDNESFSFTLRTGVKFSDGTAFNAAAVKAWIQHELEGARRRRAHLPGQPHHHRRDQPDPAHAPLQQAHPAAALRLQPGARDGRDRQPQGRRRATTWPRTPTARASTCSTRRRPWPATTTRSPRTRTTGTRRRSTGRRSSSG